MPDFSDSKPDIAETAFERDQLGRKEFVRSICDSLLNAVSESGFVVTVDGPWGSGKTRTLEMVESLISSVDIDDLPLSPSEERPLVVHFNPWLVGERDALLDAFLGAMMATIGKKDLGPKAAAVAEKLALYGERLNLALAATAVEPQTAGLVAAVCKALKFAWALIRARNRNLEARRKDTICALRKFDRKIIVFIDDVDRLYAEEVYELVRIIKAVGDFPNVRYLVAWDSRYVVEALGKLKIPMSETYLDKIVQIRHVVPLMSDFSRRQLINVRLRALYGEEGGAQFDDPDHTLQQLYSLVLRRLLEFPRDIHRVFDAAEQLKLVLFGEIALPDLIGMAALQVKGPAVFQLLQKSPDLFASGSELKFSRTSKMDEADDIESRQRKEAYSRCDNPSAIKELVHFLFPEVAAAEGGYASSSRPELGRIGNPSRLKFALQLASGKDVPSLTELRRFMNVREERRSILASLSSDIAGEFIESLGLLGKVRPVAGQDLLDLCTDIAESLDEEPFRSLTQSDEAGMTMRLEWAFLNAIDALCDKAESEMRKAISFHIASCENGLTMAAEILYESFLSTEQDSLDKAVRLGEEQRQSAIEQFGSNCLKAAVKGFLFDTARPGAVLTTLAKLCPSVAPQLFSVWTESDADLDAFARSILEHSYSAQSGKIFRIPKDEGELTAFCPLEVFVEVAERRLSDSSVDYPTRAAWMAAVTGAKHYASNGKTARF